MGRVLSSQFDRVLETSVDNAGKLTTWLAVEVTAETDVRVYGLYLSVATDAADDVDITNNLHFARYVILRDARLNVNANLGLQTQVEKAQKIWEKTCYGYFSGDASHEFRTPFKLPAGGRYTFAVDFGWSGVALANTNFLRFCVRGEYAREVEPRALGDAIYAGKDER